MNWQQLSQSPLEDILAWAETQPWCTDMAACIQDARWHSEGDVWTHTKMVCQQLLLLEDWSELTDHEKGILIFTALFHDVAKPATTQIDPATGQVSSPKHAVKGEHTTRRILRDLGCDLETREHIAQLVRNHGRPAFLLERSNPQSEVVRMSWLLSNRLLYLFALADTRGRDTDSMSRPEENLHYWKYQCEELGCFDRAFPFETPAARFAYFRQSEPNLHYVPHENYSCTATVMSGLPGSGKDRWLVRNRGDLPIVSLDEIRRELKVDPTENQGEVIQLATERCKDLLRAGKSFAFNATNILKQTRQRWLGVFADYHARIELVYVEPPFERILAQNKSRSEVVPERVIRQLADKLEPPTILEGHELVRVDK